MHSGIQSWKNLVSYAFHAFSVPLLFRTLFLPWKMDKNTGTYYVFIERFVFSVFLRVLGFLARSILIIVGLIFSFCAILTFPIFLLLPIKIDRESLESLGSFGFSLSYGNSYTLNAYSRDLYSTQKIYGKDKALRMIGRGLSKEFNRNILIVGNVGVGKSALVAHLGRLGHSGLSFQGLRYHRVVGLSIEGLSATLLDKCLEEAASAGNIILVIENIHLYEDFYEKFLPYLELSYLGVIGTTDFLNYDHVLKNNPEFLSKFLKVDLEETSESDTCLIIKNYAHLSGLIIKEDAVLEIVRLTDRLIGNQSQPAKSLSVLEELQTLNRTITLDDVRQVISDKTNIPIGAIGKNEQKTLMELESAMRKKIIGQDEAVQEVSEALRRLRTGISDRSKPAGSFLFLGPTGVGKTYTAKILTESYFGRRDAMIRFDMSEFSLESSVVSFTDRLSGAIEENPLSLVFFDELEKSHISIRNLFLQILDEGRLTRASGREASFKESLVIATSNAGSVDIIANSLIDKSTLINILIQNHTFTPEFLNRFSGIILFKPLSKSDTKKIASLLIKELAERLLDDKGIALSVTDSMLDKIASAGFDPKFGARPIKRAIEDLIENKVAEYVIAGNIGGVLVLD